MTNLERTQLKLRKDRLLAAANAVKKQQRRVRKLQKAKSPSTRRHR